MWQQVISELMSPFSKTAVTFESLEETMREATEALRFTIRSNRIVRVMKTKDQMETTRVRGYVALIEDTINHFKVPDVDFIVSLPDFPISYHRQSTSTAPVFCFCKSNQERCLLIPFPRYGRDEVGLSCMYGEYQNWSSWNTWGESLAEILELNSQSAWEDKDTRCLFAGHTHDWAGARLRFAELALDNPEKFDLYLTRMPAMHHERDTERVKPLVGRYVQMKDYCKYKYLMHIDGNTLSERMRYLLAFNSVVIKNESPYKEFFYGMLRPFEHFIPCRTDLSDLLHVLEQLEGDQRYAQYVAESGVNFAKTVLDYKNVLLFIKESLEAYAQLQRFN